MDSTSEHEMEEQDGSHEVWQAISGSSSSRLGEHFLRENDSAELAAAEADDSSLLDCNDEHQDQQRGGNKMTTPMNDADYNLFDNQELEGEYMDDYHEPVPAGGAASANHQNDKDEPEDELEGFIRRVFDTTVDGPCRGVTYRMPESFCATMNLEDQLDLLGHCRRPLEFLSLFSRDESSSEQRVEVLPVAAGMYVVPTFCEYCGAAQTSLCDSKQCQRPRLYFQKKRPPFAKRDDKKWDAATDFALPTASNAAAASVKAFR
ncbi:hypothetical protein MPSEU_000938300 [Mayamaea pseudoterrestris]|nr:hypothetical protein MPSEU_000938300 [Mayamaea pseudoterrestris]